MFTNILVSSKKILTLNLHIIVGDDFASLSVNWFGSKGKDHLSEWQPEVWNHDNFFKARRVSRWPMELSNGLMNAKDTAS